MPDMPNWLLLLVGLAATVVVARIVLRMAARWWLWIVGAVLLVAVLQAGTLTNLLS